ncbi:MAG: molecular chaperone TorD family protein [Verrucomicrobiales bacterium]|nr:molecular chaperone TorD family protein [Verrucomicrobiales bacterium]
MNSTSEEIRAIVGLYHLFANLLSEELNPHMRDILIQNEVLAVLSKAEPEVEKYLSGDWGPTEYEEAAVDFCDTFILPDSAIAPRAVAWLGENDFASAEGIHSVVEAFLKQGQITIPPSFAQLPYDHASLLFYMAATLRQIESEQAADFEQATLGSWINPFGRALQKAENPLYRALGHLIETA